MQYLRTWFLVVVLIISGYGWTMSQNPDADQKRRDSYQQKMAQFEQDRKSGKTADAEILFVGSSSFTVYVGFEEDFGEYPAVNLGFGGSQLSDVIYFFDILVKPYHPRQIVVYEGDNDLNAGLTVEEFMRDVRTFVRMVQVNKPGTLISFLAPKPSPSRMKLTDVYREAWKALSQFAYETPGVEFIDVATPMYRMDGKIRTDIWKSDSLHMNRVGYEEIWGPVLRAHIRD